MNEKKLLSVIQNFKRKQAINPDYFSESWEDLSERQEYYQSFTGDKLRAMTEDEFSAYIGKLWSMLMWGNKKYIIEKLIDNNGFEKIKRNLVELLFEKKPIDQRWDCFIKEVKGVGPSTISELLTYVNPQECMILNKTTMLCFEYLEIDGIPKYNYQYAGKKYIELCNNAANVVSVLRKNGIPEANLLFLNYFFWDEILPMAEKKLSSEPVKLPDIDKISNKESKSLHDEIKDKLVAIGELLGFESRAEVRIASGAVVDAIWEAKIGNMGKAIYVFEVQSKGSIDSLILNLKKAQSNAAVQAVVAVADEGQIERIKNESKGVIDEKSLRTWDSEDVMAVYDSLVRAHESINKLALVPESF